jgi:predicted acylesterase/phospholipase RssA
MLPQSEWAISGAGTLGSLEVGAVSALWSVTRPSALVGTSAGSIVAGLTALGHGPADLYDIVISADYAKLIPMNKWLAPFRGYLASNRNVISWLREITDNQTMADCRVPFTAICSDLNTGKARTWDSWLLPDMPVWEAILSSMSIPDIFPAWQGRYVDGGVLCNEPTAYLPGKNSRIGLRVVEKNKVGPVDGFIDMQTRLIGMLLSSGEDGIISIDKLERIPLIDLPAGGKSFLDTGMTREQKIMLYQAGFNATMGFLKTWKPK